MSAWGVGGTLLGLVLLGALVLGIVVQSKYYTRSTAEMAFVRTGRGRVKVVVGGGAFVFPWWHQVTWVYLGSIRLDLRRANRDALITQDRFRVDVGASFYVRVPATEEGVLRAAQSLGRRTLSAEALRELLEDELVGTLRAAAAARTLDEIHTNRQGFEQAVFEAMAEPLAQRGLILERVALAQLDQTAMDWYDQNNVFDAVGLEQITRQVTTSRIARNDYERNAEVTIARRNVEAQKTILALEQERIFAEHEQKSAVEEHEAETRTRTRQFIYAQEEAERKAAIERDRRIREHEIEKDRQVREKELEREITLIGKEMEREKAQLEKERELGIAAWERDRAINAARRITSIELSENEILMFQRQAERLRVEAEMKKAEQEVLTAEALAQAERERRLAAIAAERERQVAELKAAAIERLAEAHLREGEAQVQVRRLQVEAENQMQDKFIVRDVLLNLIQQAPSIARELMEPARHIESLRIVDLNAPFISPNGASSGTAERLLETILRSGAVLPLLKELLQVADLDTERWASLLGRAKVPVEEQTA